MFDRPLQYRGDKSDRTVEAVHEAEWETLKWVDRYNNRRPRYLLSKLLTCGCCGGGMSMVNKVSFSCSAARNKGANACTNKRLIKREELEDRVLSALTTHLMQPAALEQFCEAYVAERTVWRQRRSTAKPLWSGSFTACKRNRRR